MNGQHIGYKRVSTADQNTARQFEGVQVDRTFEDKASGKSTDRPGLQSVLAYCRTGDTLVVQSMDRLARSLVHLRTMANDLTTRGVTVEFIKEQLKFAGEDAPMAILMLSLLGAFAEFERSLIHERQREGIVMAKAAGRYRCRMKLLTTDKVAELKARANAGERKTEPARAFGIRRETLYACLRSGQAA